jgi:hypothetical protein
MLAPAVWPDPETLSCLAPQRRAAGIDIQAHIVDHGLAELAHDLAQEGLVFGCRQLLEVRTLTDGAQVGRERFAGGERCWLGLQPAAHINETRCIETALGVFGGRKVGWVQGDTGRLGRRMNPGDVAGATALGNQLASGTQHGRKLCKQRFMIRESSGRSRLKRPRQRSRNGSGLRQVGPNHRHPARRSRASRRRACVVMAAERSSAITSPPGQALAQLLRDTARAAAGIQNALVAG